MVSTPMVSYGNLLACLALMSALQISSQSDHDLQTTFIHLIWFRPASVWITKVLSPLARIPDLPIPGAPTTPIFCPAHVFPVSVASVGSMMTFDITPPFHPLDDNNDRLPIAHRILLNTQ